MKNDITTPLPVLSAPGNNLTAVLADEAELGPAMKRLPLKSRAFVMAMVELGGSEMARAAAMAGYTGNKSSLQVTASRLAADSRVQAALVEEAMALARASSLQALTTTINIMTNEQVAPASRLIAAGRIMGLAGMEPAQQINVSHEHKVTITQKEQIARVIELANDIGVDPKRLLGRAGITVDAEFSVVGDTTGLEDLL